MLTAFIAALLMKFCIEEGLAWANYQFIRRPAQQQESERLLGVTETEFNKALSYGLDRFALGRWQSLLDLLVTACFIGLGGLGFFEAIAAKSAESIGAQSYQSIIGLIFFALLGFSTSALSLPFEIYSTFVIEQKHGFNKQTPLGFVLDRLKGLGLGLTLGGLVLSALFWSIRTYPDSWWLVAWILITVFSLVAAWLYPTFLAPLFNKFSPLSSGELNDSIKKLTDAVGFRSSGVFVMDASRRSSHGNAYFTGLFGAKRIVLFDTLLKELDPAQTVAVLAHELGHFKLNHVRNQLIRSIVTSGLTFWLLFQLIQVQDSFSAFSLEPQTPHGTLLLLSLWLGMILFPLQPLGSYLSRKNEFAADRFALMTIGSGEPLKSALLKLRNASKSLPVTHPWFSAFYHSHPVLIDRLKCL